MCRFLLAALLLLTLPASVTAQEGLWLYHAAHPDPFRDVDTTGMRLAPSLFQSDSVYLGEAIRQWGLGDVLTVEARRGRPIHRGEISVTLAEESATSFAQITRENVGQALAIVLDGSVVTAPNILAEINSGEILITGMNLGEAESIAEAIRDATGAATPVRQRIERVDLSSPEAAAQTFIEALRLGDWSGLAETLRAETLSAMREATWTEGWALDGDSLRIDPDEFSGGEEVGAFSLRDLLGYRPNATSVEDLSDDEVLVLELETSGATSSGVSPLSDGTVRVVGVIPRSEGHVYVIVESELPDMQPANEPQPGIIPAYREGDGWRIGLTTYLRDRMF
jgi:hypothetical protein